MIDIVSLLSETSTLTILNVVMQSFKGDSIKELYIKRHCLFSLARSHNDTSNIRYLFICHFNKILKSFSQRLLQVKVSNKAMKF
jgi:hypothetical protein